MEVQRGVSRSRDRKITHKVFFVIAKRLEFIWVYVLERRLYLSEDELQPFIELVPHYCADWGLISLDNSFSIQLSAGRGTSFKPKSEIKINRYVDIFVADW